jgi:hypothetical protein
MKTKMKMKVGDTVTQSELFPLLYLQKKVGEKFENFPQKKF